MRVLSFGSCWVIASFFVLVGLSYALADDTVDPKAPAADGGDIPASLRLEDADGVSAQPLSGRNPAVMELRAPLRRCLAYYFFRPESNEERGPWGVMHAAVGFGVDASLRVGSQTPNAIGWLCWNQPCYGRQLLYSDGRQIIPRLGPGYQGHDGQFLQILALSRVPRDFVLKVEDRDYTVEDLVRHEQATCRAGTELTFKLIGLVHYLGTDSTWRSGNGELWSIERLVEEELAQPVIGAACGGTHRIMALSFAVRKRRKEGLPVSGVWLRADRCAADFADRALRMHNADGSFSTNWFERPGNADDIDRKLETTGHNLEWLLVYLPDNRLEDPPILRAAQYLTQLMWDQRGHEWEIGPKGHAIHALALYDERVFGGQPGKRKHELTSESIDEPGF